MSKFNYTRDFYFIPTIIYHNGDGIYWSLELAWLKWSMGIYVKCSKGDKYER